MKYGGPLSVDESRHWPIGGPRELLEGPHVRYVRNLDGHSHLFNAFALRASTLESK